MARDSDPEKFRRGVNNFNKMIIGLQKLGVAFGSTHLLTVPGRRSGQPRIAPVAVVTIDGSRYLFQAYPRSAWVANVRAAGTATLSRGRRARTVRLEEVPAEARRPLLRVHVGNSSARVGKLFVDSGLVEKPDPDSVAAAAERIAVFRIEAE
ncbi:nitroreductase/quinone reductase family protein [Nocardia tengchongensis]|uniref:Nitroreductase family deazaflavin-dependent oxidoreductase n=1 Tax=Nocardia tengchongensis TaxID=2055889 RepID=A0ABX8CL34_9NOCA|nr:nitroreductase/quinone reductase family protein [Nocardia tengchongensis]QVI20674.1 nitroreductase family deazaflavin-dependent oxidoreductase [Nocardia tengchongensis]